MPKRAKELGALEVKRLKHGGTNGNEYHSVGGVSGLVMQITPSGATSWILRTMVGAKRRHIGLGPYPDVQLAQAREKAREAKELISQGVDPVERKKALRAELIASQRRGLLFKDAVERYLAATLTSFKNPKHKQQWANTIATYAEPEIGDMLCSEIEVGDVVRILQPIWQTKAETATRLRGRLERVLAWATVNGHRSGENPARWKNNLDALLPKANRKKKTVHHPALQIADGPTWFADLQSRDGIATRALEFLALTAARSGEIRGAVWDEIDMAATLWTIPAERTKTGAEHRTPLTPQMSALLEALPRHEGNGLLFPAPRGGQLSDAALSACMRRMNEARDAAYLDRSSGRPAVPHGLRSTFRDWCAERGYPRELAEISLAHSVGSEVERAYRRSDLIERRRDLMASWGGFLAGREVPKVVSISGAM